MAKRSWVLALSILSGGPSVQAHEGELFYGADPVIVDLGTPQGRAYHDRMAAGRPTPVIPIPVVQAGAQLNNIRVPAQLGQYQCGTRSEARLVLCLDGAGHLSYTDSLAALAFASAPTDVFVPNDEVREYVASLLAQLPKATGQDVLHVSTTPCADECAHQIRLERKS